MSKWIVKVVKKAFESSNDDSTRLHQIKAHEVRALSSSWALLNGSSMEDIMTASFWRGHTTF